MRPNKIVIATMSLLGAGVAAWAIAAWLKPAPLQTVALRTHWIPLPEGSMDARDPRVRRALLSSFSLDGVYSDLQMRVDFRDTLVSKCGATEGALPNERYRLLIGDHTLAKTVRLWRVDMQRHGDMMHVEMHDESLRPPPPEPGSKEVAIEQPVPSIVSRDVPLTELDALRAQLSTPALWRTSDALHGCTDGQPAMLDACVDGHYYASSQACTHHAEIEQLWKTVTATFPSPSDWVH